MDNKRQTSKWGKVFSTFAILCLALASSLLGAFAGGFAVYQVYYDRAGEAAQSQQSAPSASRNPRPPWRPRRTCRPPKLR